MSRVEELENEIKGLENRKIELLKELEVEKQKTVIEYPFAESEEYWGLDIDGELIFDRWTGCKYDEDCFELGNTFKTSQEAKKERDKRILLTRFRQFRDKCNGDWKPDFKDVLQDKYSIQFNYNCSTIFIFNSGQIDSVRLFGYFKEYKDAGRAIELFGDEIKRLYLEE